MKDNAKWSRLRKPACRRSTDRKARGNNGSKPSLDHIKLTLPKDFPWKMLGALHTDLAVFLSEDENMLIHQILRDRDVDAYSLLMEDWGLQNVSKNPGMLDLHISEIRAKYQLAAFLKKYRFKTDKDMREAAAVEKFHLAEAACQAYNHGGYNALSWGETEFDAKVFTYAKSFLQKVLGAKCLSKDLLTLGSRHGPGSNLDTLKGNSNSYFKYANWPYSCTQEALPFARFLIQTDKRWLGFLENSYRERFSIPPTLILDREEFWSRVFKIVDGNRITFVPKDARTERTIAIEPCMNLMLQLGVDRHIRRRLKRWDIDLDTQVKNQVLAYRGTVYSGDNEYVTLDLSAASDSLSLKLCELLLPSEWHSYLCKLRSPQGRLGNEIINYEKISSMGNGYTFALESAIFASLIYGAVRAQSGTCNFKEDMAVFGDDLICRRKHVDRVIRALGLAGFKLNLDKSFVKGQVKESCGMDWIQGKPVRPIFLEDRPEDVLGLFVEYNRLKRLLSLRFGIEDSKVCRLVRKWIPEQFRKFTGPCSDTDFESYIHVERPTVRYKNGLWKYNVLIRRPVKIRSARDFFCRKMMHDLRGTGQVIPPHQWEKRKKRLSAPKDNEGRFAVFKSYSYTVGTTFSETSYWSSEYTEDSAGLTWPPVVPG